MRYKLAEDAKPQVWLLLFATVITIALWFIPYADYLVYPIRLFVTFVHESSHALAAVLTGGSVQSLSISADGSGVVYSLGSGFFGNLLTSSAGYLGTAVFGVGLLYLIRRNVSPNKILVGLGLFVAVMTVVFTIVSPIFNFLSLNVAVTTLLFTIIAAIFLTSSLITLGIFSNVRVANFAVAFLAVQFLLNSISDQITVLFINAPLIGTGLQNDAANMHAVTGIPAFFWVIIWIGISLFMISLGLRLYAVNRSRATSTETVFED